MAQPGDDDIEFLIDRRRKEWELEEASQSKPASFSGIIELTDANFDSTLKGQRLMLVDFWAPWCGPCRWVSPILEQIAQENAGKLVLGKLNVDENPLTSQCLGIEGIPTVMIAQNGKIVDQIVGALPKEDLDQVTLPYQASGSA
ncbi:MAG: thioredoxin [Conexivisphaerales archaeon]